MFLEPESAEDPGPGSFTNLPEPGRNTQFSMTEAADPPPGGGFRDEAPKFDVKGFEQSKKPGTWLTQNLLSATDLKIPEAWTQIGRSGVDD